MSAGATIDFQTLSIPDQLRIYDSKGVLVAHTVGTDGNTSAKYSEFMALNPEHVLTNDGTVTLSVTADDTYKLVVNESGQAETNDPECKTNPTTFYLWIEGENKKTRKLRIIWFKDAVWNPEMGKRYKKKKKD